MTEHTVQCMPCRWCGACGCERGGECQAHQSFDHIIASAVATRAEYERKRADPECAFAVLVSGKIHNRDCTYVLSRVRAVEDFLSHPAEYDYGVATAGQSQYPKLLTRAEAEEPVAGRKRCAVCAPDVRTTRPIRPGRLGEGDEPAGQGCVAC